MNFGGSEKTNERSVFGTAGAQGGGVGACAAALRLAVQPDDCGVDFHAVCETFGPERSCDCVPRTKVGRFLARFGEPA